MLVTIIMVPAAVPLLFQSCRPLAGVQAEKYTRTWVGRVWRLLTNCVRNVARAGAERPWDDVADHTGAGRGSVALP